MGDGPRIQRKTEAEYEDIISKVTSLELESKKVEQTYYKKFHTVLSWKKIHRVRIALGKWNMELLRQFSPQQAGGQPDGWLDWQRQDRTQRQQQQGQPQNRIQPGQQQNKPQTQTEQRQTKPRQGQQTQPRQGQKQSTEQDQTKKTI